MIILISIFAVLAAVFMFFAVKEGKKANIANMKKLVKLSGMMVSVSVFAVLVTIGAMAAPETAVNGFTDKSFAFIAAALATGAAAIASGYAVAASSSAAIGAISENEKISGKALIYVVMGEGIALYGVIISVMILNKI